MDGMIADWAMGNFKLNLEGVEPGSAEYGLILAMKDEITKIASEYKKPKVKAAALLAGCVSMRCCEG